MPDTITTLDTIKSIETPEGVQLPLTCAGFYIRSIAWLLDALIQGVLLLLLGTGLSSLGELGTGLFLIVVFIINWFYPVLFEIYMHGQTPGKRIMKIQVLLMDGTLVNWGASMLRNLLRTVDFLPFMYLLGFISMLLSKDFRRLGDLAANTIVVYKRSQQHKAQIPEAEPLAPALNLTAREQQSIVSYAERLRQFSPQRAEELALLATPLVQDLPDNIPHPASQRLLGIASYLVGRR